MTSRPSLSKTRFVAGTQCHLRLWYDSYARHLASLPGESLQAIFETGQKVGELAQRRFQGGHLVAHDHRHVHEALDETRLVINAGTAPSLFEGAFEHCFAPYACPYHPHCTHGQAVSDHGFDEFPRLSPEHHARLDAMGIREIRDVPDDFPLNRLQRTVRQAVIDGQPWMHGDIHAELARRLSPVRYLNFETFAPAIPRFTGTRPHDAIPFLFSVHTERDGAPPAHRDYLHARDDDPRPAVAERLLEALGSEGTICTYSGYSTCPAPYRWMREEFFQDGCEAEDLSVRGPDTPKKNG